MARRSGNVSSRASIGVTASMPPPRSTPVIRQVRPCSIGSGTMITSAAKRGADTAHHNILADGPVSLSYVEGVCFGCIEYRH